MKTRNLLPLLDWAGRDLLRHPAETLLLALALVLLVTISGIGVLLPRALRDAANGILAEGPAIVVRRVGPVGWQPLPVAEAVAAAKRIPGALGIRARIWGLATGPAGAVTVVGREDPLPLNDSSRWQPTPGQAIAGRGVAGVAAGQPFPLTGLESLTLELTGTFAPAGDLAGFDVVALHPGDARRLLGLQPGQATDLALDVFHPEEAAALVQELASAFPWPVSVMRRSEEVGRFSAAAALRGGLVTLMLAPALLALALLMSLGVRQSLSRRHEVGLLKALGWCGADVVQLLLLRTTLIALPAVVCGMATAYGLLFFPGLSWATSGFLGWRGGAPALFLDPGGMLPPLFGVAGLVLVPFFAAALFPALKAAAADPQDLLEAGSQR